jgi:hypothetical protein
VGGESNLRSKPLPTAFNASPSAVYVLHRFYYGPLNHYHEWKEATAKANLLLLMETLESQVDASLAGQNILAYC